MTDEDVARPTSHYPPADITPAQFESFVADLLWSAQPDVDDLKVTLHESITGVDGTYDFDATIRYQLAGMDFLVLVEAKRHKNPIKRELVQVLREKILSVGAQKGVMISTAPYQSGALNFAKTHGIALVTVTEGRFTFESRGANQPPLMTREEAWEKFRVPTFVGHCYGPGASPNSTAVTLVSSKDTERVADLLLAFPQAS
ncbi:MULTISPECIES: restriction endonuclease [Streptacidiphilus]|uniref:Restriction endonuclease n=1 Tax=Streptacidiphilus cavernicola TaxID=3342716 RepID=A0ABV6UTN8_9ACTN|nr:restriction endonuclease [Streptacidiphilus jeojiense]